MSKRASANVSYLIGILSRMALLSEEILEAGAQGEEALTRSKVDVFRQLTADLQEIESKYRIEIDTLPSAQKNDVVKLLPRIQKSEAFIKAWCHRYNGIYTAKQLSLNTEGRNALIDHLIPLAWNWKYDLIILSDKIEDGFIECLVTRGQERIVVFCEKTPKEIRFPEVTTYIQNKEAVFHYFQQLGLRQPKRINNFMVLLDNNDEIENDNKYSEHLEELKKAWRNGIVNSNTIYNFGRRWMMQGLENLPAIAAHPSINKLLEEIKEIPVIIASPGPSLAKNIKQLHHAKGKALIIAPAQTASALYKADINPDIIVVADPGDILYLMADIEPEKVSILLVGVACHPSFFDKYKGKIVTFNVNSGIDTWITNIFNDQLTVGAGGSVSTAIFNMALHSRCNPIILVGQDLALTNGQQYLPTATDGEMKVSINKYSGVYSYSNVHRGYENLLIEQGTSSVQRIEPVVMLPGYYGGTVESKTDYAYFHTEFENMASNELKKNNHVRLINCTEGGAHIAGFEHTNLHDALNELKPIIINATDIQKNLHSQLNIAARSKLLIKSLEIACKSLKRSLVLARQCKKIVNDIHQSKVGIEALHTKEKELIAAIQGSTFISLGSQDEIRNALKLSEKACSVRENLDASNILYEVAIRDAPSLIPLVESAITALRKSAPY